MEMTDAIYIYIIVALLVGAAYGIAIRKTMRHHTNSLCYNILTKQHIKQIVSEYICNHYPQYHTKGIHINWDDENKNHTSRDQIRSESERMAVAKAIYEVMAHTYSTPTDIIQKLAKDYKIEEFLLSKLRWASVTKKIEILNYMSTISISHITIGVISHYLSSQNRHLRIAALIAILAASPTKAISIIANLCFELRPYDISRIILLLRRGILPIAYEPLLTSDNHNLLRLGIAIVRNFEIGIADKHLYNIIARTTNQSIVCETIYTLALLGRPLGRQPIRRQLTIMPDHSRRELCLHLCREGYSLASLQALFSESELLYTKDLINSYKRDLACWYSN